MDRDEFMELVYETFADEPDNVLANGIIEAADAYVEHEKAQLSQEGTTSDLISRQAAIDALDKRFDNIPMEQTAEILMLRKDLRELPTVQHGQHWIPVSERLPEEDGFYLVTINYGGAAWAHESYFMQCNSRGVHWDYSDVTAWMPMPEHYKGE